MATPGQTGVASGVPISRAESMIAGLGTRWPGPKLVSGGLRFGVPLAGSLLTDQINQRMPSGAGREFLANAVTSAGLGGTFGPEGSAVAALASVPYTALNQFLPLDIGKRWTGLMSAISGGGEEQPAQGAPQTLKDTLSTLARAQGVDANPYLSTFDTYKALGYGEQKDAQGNKLGDNGIAQLLASQIVSQGEQNRADAAARVTQAQQSAADAKWAMALQQNARDYFAPYANAILTSGQAQSQLMNKMADQAPAGYGDVFRNQAAQALNSASSISAAYAAQGMLQPGQIIANEDLKRRQQLAQSQADALQIVSSILASQKSSSSSGSNALDQAASGGSSGGGGGATTGGSSLANTNTLAQTLSAYLAQGGTASPYASSSPSSGAANAYTVPNSYSGAYGGSSLGVPSSTSGQTAIALGNYGMQGPTSIMLPSGMTLSL